MEANVKVIVKVRPPLDTPRELLCWKVSPHSGEITQIKTKTTKDEMMQPMAIQRNLETFSFEQVFDYPTTNKQVYDNQCSAIVSSVLDGYNGTIFLYGQTKSGRHFEQGKTYTMLGCQDKLGILHYALTHIFTHKENRDNPKKLKVYISYLEIYNENLIDLLNPKSDPSLLKIKEDNRLGIVISNLRQQKVKSMDEALHLLNFGEEFRVSSSYFEKYRVTDYNSHSSRSHTIYKVYVEASTSTAKGGKKTTFSCLVAKTLFKNLVDLAGSERLSVNLDSEENDKETKFINKSLFYLTKVIFMLSTGNQ